MMNNQLFCVLSGVFIGLMLALYLFTDSDVDYLRRKALRDAQSSLDEERMVEEND